MPHFANMIIFETLGSISILVSNNRIFKIGKECRKLLDFGTISFKASGCNELLQLRSKSVSPVAP